MSDLCIRHLTREHRRLEEAASTFEIFLKDQARAAHWGATEIEDFRALDDLFHKPLERHMRKEENFLFPALEAFLPSDLGPLAVLRGEHEDVRELYRRIQAGAVLRASGSTSTELIAKLQHYATGLVTVLRNHMQKEDRILFPMVTRFLAPERDAELLRQMELLDVHKESGAEAGVGEGLVKGGVR